MGGEQLEDRLLVMGRIAAPYGVNGWVHVTAYTELPENLLHYLPWHIYRQGKLAGGGNYFRATPWQGSGGAAERQY